MSKWKMGHILLLNHKWEMLNVIKCSQFFKGGCCSNPVLTSK